MTLPTCVKSHQIRTAVTSPGNSTVETQIDNLLLEIMGALQGAGTWKDQAGGTVTVGGQWVVRSSCDGAGGFGNGDGVDRCTTIAQIVHAAGGSNHSWKVLRQTGIAAAFELLIDCNSAGTSTITWTVSRSGFGAAAGGADGTATAAPTAAANTGITLESAGLWGGPSAANFATVVNAVMSTDGSLTRIFLCRNGHTVGMLLFDLPANSQAAWTTPYYAFVKGVSTSAPSSDNPTSAEIADSAAPLFKGKFGTITAAFALCSLGFMTSGALFNVFTAADSYESVNQLFECRVASVTASAVGTPGQVVDMWLGRSNVACGTGYPATPGAGEIARMFMQFGSLVVPWNGSVAVIA